jgi:hypothetical protein
MADVQRNLGPLGEFVELDASLTRTPRRVGSCLLARAAALLIDLTGDVEHIVEELQRRRCPHAARNPSGAGGL